VQDAPDLAMGQAIAFDQLSVRPPLLLELPERRGVHHGAGLELLDMDVHQGSLPNEMITATQSRACNMEFPSISFVPEQRARPE
jgi:hypothetical protein